MLIPQSSDTCPACKGTGKLESLVVPRNGGKAQMITCTRCGGTGHTPAKSGYRIKKAKA